MKICVTGITTGTLTEERQKEVFERAMTEFKGSTIDRWPLTKRIIRRCYFRRLLKTKTLLEFMKELHRLNDEQIYFGSLEEFLTIPYIGLTKEELYSMGLDKKNVDDWMKLHYEEVFVIANVPGGKDIYEKAHSYRK